MVCSPRWKRPTSTPPAALALPPVPLAQPVAAKARRMAPHFRKAVFIRATPGLAEPLHRGAAMLLSALFPLLKFRKEVE
jgi:hypothetical protein